MGGAILKNIIILFLSLGPSVSAYSNSLNTQHVLAPIDYEYLLFNGIEYLPSGPATKKIINECNLSPSNTNIDAIGTKKEILCRVYDQVDIHSWDNIKQGAFWGRDAQVLYFGERHLDAHIQIEFARILPQLKKDGFTTLALEIFPKSTQAEIDAYLLGHISLEEILKILSKHWSYKQEGYAQILYAAKFYGFKIIGIDQRQGIQTEDLVKNIAERDDIMADVIAEHLLKSKEEKVVVYIGALHAPLSLSKAGAIKSQIEKLEEILLKENRTVPIESYIFKTSVANTLFNGIMFAKELALGGNTAFFGRQALHYADGMIFVYPQNKLPEDIRVADIKMK